MIGMSGHALRSLHAIPVAEKEAASPSRRLYDAACPLAGALNLVGDRWTIPILKELQFGGKRFNELKASLPGISAHILSLRISELEERSLVIRVQLPPPALVNIYTLTEQGIETRKFIVELIRWAVQTAALDPTKAGTGPSFAMLLLATFCPDNCIHPDVLIGFQLPDLNFLLELRDGRPEVRAGVDSDADVKISGSAPAVANYVFGRSTLDQAMNETAFEYAGDVDVLRAMPDWFRSPRGLSDCHMSTTAPTAQSRKSDPCV